MSHLYFPAAKVPSHIVPPSNNNPGSNTPSRKNKTLAELKREYYSDKVNDENCADKNGTNYKTPAKDRCFKLFTPKKLSQEDLDKVEEQLARLTTSSIADNNNKEPVKVTENDLMQNIRREFRDSVMPRLSQCTETDFNLITSFVEKVVNRSIAETKEEEVKVKQEKHEEVKHAQEGKDDEPIMIDLTVDFPQNKDPDLNDLNKIAVKTIDGAFATAYTPVRVHKKKERELLGAEYVVSPVRRSARQLKQKENEEVETSGESRQLPIETLLNDFGYAFSPNPHLQ